MRRRGSPGDVARPHSRDAARRGSLSRSPLHVPTRPFIGEPLGARVRSDDSEDCAATSAGWPATWLRANRKFGSDRCHRCASSRPRTGARCAGDGEISDMRTATAAWQGLAGDDFRADRQAIGLVAAFWCAVASSKGSTTRASRESANGSPGVGGSSSYPAPGAVGGDHPSWMLGRAPTSPDLAMSMGSG